MKSKQRLTSVLIFLLCSIFSLSTVFADSDITYNNLDSSNSSYSEEFNKVENEFIEEIDGEEAGIEFELENNNDNTSKRKKRDILENKVGGKIIPGVKGFAVIFTNFGVDKLDSLHIELKLYDNDGALIDTHKIDDTKIKPGKTAYTWMKSKSNTVQEKITITGYAKDGKTIYKILPRSTVRWNFVGGAYGRISAYGGQVHHCPANSVNGLTTYKGPSIRMLKEDHKKTASYGSSKKAKKYREEQQKLINEGKFLEAQKMDIKDIQKNFGKKYDKAIKEMVKYTKDELGYTK